MSTRQTIFALSSGQPPSGVAIIRISGPGTRFVIETMTNGLPPARMAVLREIRDRNRSVLDSGLVLFFPAPHSFTGEDCAEFQVHGSRAVVLALLRELGTFEDLRHAEPGEFTRRAFENGRMDLTEIEGLSDLIAAQTEMQRRFALDMSSGGLRTLYDGWAKRLAHARAMIEAELDFADEDDVPGSVSAAIWRDMTALRDELETHLQGAPIAERIRDGFRIVIAGPPNAGKSSLINALARRDVAIVSEEAGTTRDVISVDMDLGGYPVTVTDTAGLRETESAVEREGIRRAYNAIETADITLMMVDLTQPFAPFDVGQEMLVVGNKGDIAASTNRQVDAVISAKTGEGLTELLLLLQERLSTLYPVHGLSLPNRQRQIAFLEDCESHIRNATEAPATAPVELRAEDLRLAQDALGRITGRVDPDDLLGLIFAEFCIGK